MAIIRISNDFFSYNSSTVVTTVSCWEKEKKRWVTLFGSFTSDDGKIRGYTSGGGGVSTNEWQPTKEFNELRLKTFGHAEKSVSLTQAKSFCDW